MSKFNEFIQGKEKEYGERFDPSELAPQFIPFFDSGKKIRVMFRGGEELTGTVGVSTGWRPVFLLMRRTNSIGSLHVLKRDTIITGVLSGGKNYSDYLGLKGELAR